MDILGISEMRWTRNGKICSKDKTILYSGHEDQHIRGFGMILSKAASQALIGWKPVNERIITARFQSKHTKTTIVQVYAPTEDADEDDKDKFYDQLQDTIDDIPSHDIKLLIGDMNAQISKNRQGIEHVIGPHATSCKTNDNGERLILFCSMNNLCIGNTYFAHKSIHKKTWRSPDGHTKNEIDYICINKRWRSTIQDVRAYRGADVGTDHHLVRASLRLRFKRQKERITVRPYAIEKLKDHNTVTQYRITIQNRFEQLQYITDVNEHWKQFKEAVTESAEETISRRRGTQKERWIRNSTWQLIDERKTTKIQRDQAKTPDEQQAAAAKYKSLDRKVKRSCRADKKEWLKQKGDEAQEAANRNDAKTLYQIVRELTGSRSNSNTPIKDKNGKALLTKEEQVARWIEYFKETLNQPNPTTTFDFSTFATINEIEANLGTILETETRKAIKMLKNNKGAGLDEISAELVKHGGTETVKEITKLLNTCWKTTNVPDEWRKGMIVKIPKKGNIAECNNWRGITLLTIPGKIFCIVLLNRIKDAANKALREEQGGFHNGRSCNEHIFTIRNIIEQSIEFQQPLLINFIDFKKAFDSIHRESLWKIVRTYGIPEPFINIFRNIYLNSSCCVKTDIGNTEFFDIVTGVRQGCTLSPFLFLLAIDFVMREAMNDPDLGIKWNNKSCHTDLDFADGTIGKHKRKSTKNDHQVRSSSQQRWTMDQ